MIQTLLRIIGGLCVLFCCTATPALAQSPQTFTLNGLWADVTPPAGPVRLGETLWFAVALRPHGDTPLVSYRIVLDARPTPTAIRCRTSGSASSDCQRKARRVTTDPTAIQTATGCEIATNFSAARIRAASTRATSPKAWPARSIPT